MLSVSAMGSGNLGGYYLDLAREDYYLAGGEPPGLWSGKGAELLELGVLVAKDQLRNLLNGFSADGKHQLVQNAGKEDRQPGWDLTFSAPKSVSVLWSQCETDIRSVIQQAHADAVQAAFDYLQSEAADTRRGRGGVERQKAGLVVATFEHGTSRAQDPQIHTHCLVVNLCTGEDGRTGTLVSKPVYRHKMAAGAIYRAELAYLLESRLGLQAERVRSWFELQHVPKELVQEFSKRRQAIEEALAASGFNSAQAAAVATLATRDAKEHLPRAELLQGWREIGLPYLEPHVIKELLGRPPPQRDRSVEIKGAFSAAVDSITQKQSYFTEKELVRRVAEESQGRGVGAAMLRAYVSDQLDRSTEIVRLGRHDGERQFTTQEVVRLEEWLLKTVHKSTDAKRHFVDPIVLDTILERYDRAAEKDPTTKRPDGEQVEALRHIVEEPGDIKCVRGMAGTGKTFMLEVANEAWTTAGYQVYGAAIAGKAARGLQEDSGIRSDTLAMRLIELSKSKQYLPKASPDFDAKSILVVDEAGMVGTRQMADLFAFANERKMKLVLVGDERQLQSIEAGGVFHAISKEIGAVELTEIRRQREEWAKKAVKDFAHGRGHEALRAFAERGLVTIEKDREHAIQALVGDWQKDNVRQPEKALIFVGTNEETYRINSQCQQARMKAGLLAESHATAGTQKLHEGDRVLFTKKDRSLGIENGQIGTVTMVIDNPHLRVARNGLGKEEKTIVVRMDSGERVTVPLAAYQNVRLGYAVTTHKGQGATVDNAYVLAGGSMQDREISYVQGSRARNETRIYSDRFEAGEKLEGLVKQMNRTRMKTLAHELAAKTNSVAEQQTLTQKISIS